MIMYHVVSRKMLKSTLEKGLVQTSRGAKGNDALIIKTDQFLDEHRPIWAQRAGLSRDNNLYGYVARADKIIDIQSGNLIDIKYFAKQANHALLRGTIDPSRCYVPDLDL